MLSEDVAKNLAHLWMANKRTAIHEILQVLGVPLKETPLERVYLIARCRVRLANGTISESDMGSFVAIRQDLVLFVDNDETKSGIPRLLSGICFRSPHGWIEIKSFQQIESGRPYFSYARISEGGECPGHPAVIDYDLYQGPDTGQRKLIDAGRWEVLKWFFDKWLPNQDQA